MITEQGVSSMTWQHSGSNLASVRHHGAPVQATLKGLSAKFSRATETMRWLRQCASTLSRETKQTVSWTTPLGLCCVQPYFKNVHPLHSAGCLLIPHSACACPATADRSSGRPSLGSTPSA